jgi:outer membrane receptor protein involved in Fe transport
MEDSDTNGKIGMRLEIRPGLEVRGNYGSFLRLPDFLELFGNSGAVLGNPVLEPERGRNLDFGVVSAAARSGRLLNDLRLEVTYFETRADNLIQFEPTAQLYVVARNTGRARVQGGELSLSFGLGRRFNASMNATHQIARNVSGDTNHGNLLLGRPRDELSSRMELQAGRGRFFHAFTYVGRNFVDKENTESLAIPARYLHDVGYSIALPHGLTLGLEIRNVGDEEIYDIARFPLPGRSFAGRIAWAY